MKSIAPRVLLCRARTRTGTGREAFWAMRSIWSSASVGSSEPVITSEGASSRMDRTASMADSSATTSHSGEASAPLIRPR